MHRATADVHVAELCRKEGFSQPTLYKWRAKFGGMHVSEPVRLLEFEGENTEHKKLLAEAMLDMQRAKGRLRRVALAPQVRRDAARRVVQEHQLS